MTAQQRRVVVGRYDLVREIGRGGMGAVWLGRDTVLGRDVALKRVGLIPGAQSPDLARAEREARLAARLNHPHVVAVYDLVEDADETWLVMEYVEGVTLSAVVQRDGALAPDEAAWLLRQAADALAAAHRAGIVHRDVKPSNILVTTDRQVKLSDFGIARAEADASLTRTGLVTGSPAYLAPEVASGSTATEASDVWSWGATLYHLLAGEPPYNVHENLMGALYRIVHEDPPRLADAGWLAPVLEHTMAREPDQRWSMSEVRDFLGRAPDVETSPIPVAALLEDGPQLLPPTTSIPVAVPPVPPRERRHTTWPWAAVAVVLAVGIIVAAVAAGLHDRHSPTASPPTRRHSSSSSHTTSGSASSPSSPSSTQTQAAAMRSFIARYLSTVTTDQHASWSMLTPSFQRVSGGFGSYQGFWRTISSATPTHITPDPAGMTVSYGVDYVKTNGQRTSAEVTLQLVKNGTSYLIDGES